MHLAKCRHEQSLETFSVEMPKEHRYGVFLIGMTNQVPQAHLRILLAAQLVVVEGLLPWLIRPV